MVLIKGFRAVRPKKEFAHKVISSVYNDMNIEKEKVIEHYNRCSFNFNKCYKNNSSNLLQENKNLVYEKFESCLSSKEPCKIFVQDEKQSIYIYKVTRNGISRTGVICCTSINDYINNKIIRHEYTRIDSERKILEYINYFKTNINPVLLTYRENIHISSIINKWSKKEVLYSFTEEDMTCHTVWAIDDENTINTLINLFNTIEYIYIADGHHRIAAATKFAQKKRENKKEFLGDEGFNFFLSALFPDNQVMISSYNRVVKDLNGLTLERFFELVNKKFKVFKCRKGTRYSPKKKHTFGLYIKGEWYKLIPRAIIFEENNPVNAVDVSILYNNILNPILGIGDERSDSRIDFIDEVKGLKEVEKRVNNDMKVGFSLYPVSLEEVINIGSIGEVMPPKATYFQPRLVNSLFIYKLL